MSLTVALTTAAGVLLPYLDKVPKDNDVKAGWTAFAVFIGLALAVAFLGFSLTKHLRRAEENLGGRDDDASVETSTQADPAPLDRGPGEG